MARMAATDHQANWVINNDADEFWWPHEGNLKTSLERVHCDVDVVLAERTNFLPRRHEQGSFHDDMIFRQAVSLNSLGRPLPGKVCHRACPEIVVAQGNHSVSKPGHELRIGSQRPIEILHFPMRSYRQFERKILLGGAACERSTNPRAAVATWRKLYLAHKDGEFAGFYEENVIDDSAAADGVRGGTLIRDVRLRDYLTRLRR